MGMQKAYWWLRVYITAGFGDDNSNLDHKKYVADLGLHKKDEEFNAREQLGQFANGWGYHSAKRFEQIFANIESATGFGS